MHLKCKRLLQQLNWRTSCKRHNTCSYPIPLGYSTGMESDFLNFYKYVIIVLSCNMLGGLDSCLDNCRDCSHVSPSLLVQPCNLQNRAWKKTLILEEIIFNYRRNVSTKSRLGLSVGQIFRIRTWLAFDCKNNNPIIFSRLSHQRRAGLVGRRTDWLI